MEDTESSPFKRVSRVRIFEQAADQIDALVRNGYFSPGQKLPTEQELCDQFSVSRSTIREALRVLEAEGIIEIRRGLGAFIAPPREKLSRLEDLARWLHEREETLQQVLEVRISIEGLAALLAAERANEKDIMRILDIVEKQEREFSKLHDANHSGVDLLTQLDLDFHIAISIASGNDIVSEIVHHIVPAFTETNKAVLYVSKRMERMITEHRIVINAISARKPKEAEQAMRQHLIGVQQVILSQS